MRRDTFPFLLAGLLILSWFLSSWLSADANLGFWGRYERFQGFYTMFYYGLFFLLAYFIINNDNKLSRAIWAINISVLFACIYGLLQFFSIDFVFWIEPASETGRIFSTLGQPNFFGHFLIMAIPLTVYSFFHEGKRWFFLSLFILEMICLFLTYSRSAWIGFCLSAFLFILFVLYIKGKKKAFLASISTTIIIIASISLIGFSGILPKALPSDPLAYQRLQSFFNLKEGSIGLRFEYWQTALKIIGKMSPQRLILGYGPENIQDEYISNYEKDWALFEFLYIWPDRAHNVVLDTVMQFGLLNLFIWSAFLAYIFLRVIRYLKSSFGSKRSFLVLAISVSLTAYLINNLFSFSLTTSYVYFYLYLAILFCLLNQDKKIIEYKVILSPPAKYLILSSLAIFSGILIYFHNIQFIRADHHFMLSAKKKDDCLASRVEISKALLLNPYMDQYKDKFFLRSVNCLEEISSGQAHESMKEDVDRLIKYLPAKERNYSFSLSLAVAKAALTNFGYDHGREAEREFERLIERYPDIPAVYRIFGYFKMRSGDHEGAIDILKKGLEKLPENLDIRGYKKQKGLIREEKAKMYEYLGISYEMLGHDEKAELFYNKASSLSLEEDYQ
ncbi:hypothetical protein GF382_03675 [Candidatus Falkowbacteria bacterium]|nr:hypothetical protein [Candidatus Falkowbacteria bacterium]